MLKKHKFYWNLIPIILISVILLKSVFSIESIFSGAFSTIISILMPFFWAFGIAYLLNPITMLFEKKFNMKRSFSILLTYIITLILLTFLILVIFPTIIESISDLAKNLSSYITSAEAFITDSFAKLTKESPNVSKEIETVLLTTFTHLAEFLTEFMKGLLGHTIRFTSSFIKFLFGFIISIYMLIEKEKIKKFSIRLLKAILPSEKSDFTINFFAESNNIFSRFIVGKTIDSLIIGVLCYIGLIIIQAPFAILIALIVAMTNMIPYFGPFIGMVPAFILTFFVNPTLAFIVLFFILLLQQFDGWYLGPKILGDQVGVSPLLIILAVTVGGGVGGVLGMFLSVPIAALIKVYTDKYLTLKEKKKKELSKL
ncbi:MAG: AI-2E family transporter [Sarcina sp.]